MKKLRGQSGFGWDDERQMVTAPSDVWDEYLKTHPKAKPWRKKTYPLFEDMAELVDGVIATGKAAFNPYRSSSGPPEPALRLIVDDDIDSALFRDEDIINGTSQVCC